MQGILAKNIVNMLKIRLKNSITLIYVLYFRVPVFESIISVHPACCAYRVWVGDRDQIMILPGWFPAMEDKRIKPR